jgi:hypothetical protein
MLLCFPPVQQTFMAAAFFPLLGLLAGINKDILQKIAQTEASAALQPSLRALPMADRATYGSPCEPVGAQSVDVICVSASQVVISTLTWAYIGLRSPNNCSGGR